MWGFNVDAYTKLFRIGTLCDEGEGSGDHHDEDEGIDDGGSPGEGDACHAAERQYGEVHDSPVEEPIYHCDYASIFKSTVQERIYLEEEDGEGEGDHIVEEEAPVGHAFCGEGAAAKYAAGYKTEYGAERAPRSGGSNDAGSQDIKGTYEEASEDNGPGWHFLINLFCGHILKISSLKLKFFFLISVIFVVKMALKLVSSC